MPSGRVVLLPLAVYAVTLGIPTPSVAQDEEREPPGRYSTLRGEEMTYAGRIRGQRLRLDRFELELSDGRLYLGHEVDGLIPIAVYLGDGVLRGFAPDAVEYHQLEKLSDDHHVDEAFERLVVWSVSDTLRDLRALADPADDEGDPKRAARYLDDRREDRLEDQLHNPDGRILEDLLRRQAGTLQSDRAFLLADIDTKDEGWLTITRDPGAREEVELYKHDSRRRIRDYWLRVDFLPDFTAEQRARALDGYVVDPESLDDEVTGGALGLPARPLDSDAWNPRIRVPRAQVDLALEGNGDASGTAALLIEPLEPTRGLRLLLSQVLEVIDVRLAPPPEGDTSPSLLQMEATENTAAEAPAPDEPTPLSGEAVPFVRERDDRLMADDVFEPWITIELPRTFEAGERFVVQLAYEGELIERLRESNDFLLKDTIYWQPRHPDTRLTRLDLTFRMPERYQVASGGVMTREEVVDDTRIMRWVTDEPVRNMSFHLGQFDVTTVERASPPAVSVYGNDNHLGFAPGNREKTVEDLTASIELFSDYFGPFPFSSLLTTETPTQSGQAFPGLLLLSYQAFGELHTGEAELFRAHEVAHQWWGAAIDWEDYRDQWMSEGFAQYAAALYALQALEDEDQFLEMIDAWRHDVLGEGQVGQGMGLRHYGFSPGALQRSDGHDSGALVVGHRLNSTETPFDYRVIVYEKGAYILHMLRAMLLDPDTGSDERFRQLMRGYATAHVGGVMSTRSFENAVDEAFGEPMDWFFDQWVYGVEVPTYDVDLDVRTESDGYVLEGTVRQRDVSAGFRMPVPIHLTFENRPPMLRRIWVDEEEVRVSLPLPARPRRVDFNYHHAVLAKIR
jgi:hypothetical protein